MDLESIDRATEHTFFHFASFFPPLSSFCKHLLGTKLGCFERGRTVTWSLLSSCPSPRRGCGNVSLQAECPCRALSWLLEHRGEKELMGSGGGTYPGRQTVLCVKAPQESTQPV